MIYDLRLVILELLRIFKHNFFLVGRLNGLAFGH